MQNMRTFSKFTGLTVLAATLAALAMACLFMAGCACSASKPVATVDDNKIMDSDITLRVSAMQKAVASSEKDWNSYLRELGMTEEEVRDQLLNEMITMRLIKAHANELGVNVSDEDLASAWNALTGEMSDEELVKLAEQYGYTVEGLKDSLSESLYNQKVIEYFLTNTECDNAALQEQTKQFLENYGGQKKIQRMRVEGLNEDGSVDIQKALTEAERIKAAVESGETTFEDIYAANAVPEGDYTGVDDWTFNMILGEEYSSQFKDVGVGSLTVVNGNTYADIVRVVDVLPDASSNTAYESLPEDVKAQVYEAAKGTEAYKARDAWVESLWEKGVVIGS